MCFANWSRPDLLTLSMTILTGLMIIATCFIAYYTWGLIQVAKIGFKTIAPQEALKSQIEIVTKLVQDLSHARFPITLKHPVKSDVEEEKWNFNVFEVTFAGLLPQEMNDETVLNKLNLLEVLKTALLNLGNPLLPDSISQKLWKLKRMGKEAPNVNTWDELNYYIIGSFSLITKPGENIVIMPGNINGFKTICIELKDSITAWFKKQGVTDTNTVAFMDVEG